MPAGRLRPQPRRKEGKETDHLRPALRRRRLPGAAVEVFAGNTADPSTVASQVAKVRERFGIGRVALVGDRGMLTAARIREDLGPAGLD